MARLHDLAVEALSAGNFIIDYAPGWFVSWYSLLGLHSSVQNSISSNAKLPLKLLEMLRRPSNLENGLRGSPSLAMFSEPSESDNLEEDN